MINLSLVRRGCPLGKLFTHFLSPTKTTDRTITAAPIKLHKSGSRFKTTMSKINANKTSHVLTSATGPACSDFMARMIANWPNRVRAASPMIRPHSAPVVGMIRPKLGMIRTIARFSNVPHAPYINVVTE